MILRFLLTIVNFIFYEPTQYQIALDILNSAKEYWEANNIPIKFLVINK